MTLRSLPIAARVLAIVVLAATVALATVVVEAAAATAQDPLHEADATSSPCTELSTLDEAALLQLEFQAGTPVVPAALDRTKEYVVGDVRVVRQPIFNEARPDESGGVYRWANRLHIDTRRFAIEHAILFEPGSRASVETLEESERILRRKPYLYDARVIPRRVCGDVLDVDVVTRDVWTLNPSLDFGRTGGESDFGIGLSDPNVFGTGRGAGVRYSNDQDRSGVSAYYEDANLAGTRTVLDLLIEDNDDGSRYFMEVGQPFFSLDTRVAAGLRIDDNRFEDGLFLLSEEFATFKHDSAFASLFAGYSRGLENDRAVRWLAGYVYEDHAFDTVGGETAPVPFPEDRRYAYPWLGFEVVENDFEKAVNVEQIYRTEDVYLGAQYGLRLGYSDEAFGGDDVSRWVLEGEYRNGMRFGDRHLLIFRLEGRGFYNVEADEPENVRIQSALSYRMAQSRQFSMYASISGTYVHHLPDDEQLLLGGEEGLRGYPNRYQEGDQRVVFTLEERYFSDLYLWRVFRVGAAVFVDAGRAWFSDTPTEEPLGTLVDVGIGLRLKSTRTRSDRVLHIDLAFPLQDGPEISSSEITLTVKRSL